MGVIVAVVGAVVVTVVIVNIGRASTGRTTTMMSASRSFFGVRFGFGNRVMCGIAFVSTIDGGLGLILRFVASTALSSSPSPFVSSRIRAG